MEFNLQTYAHLGVTALQEACHAAKAAGGGRIYVPAGVWMLGRTLIPDNVTLYGDGAASILKAIDGLNDHFLINEGESAGNHHIIVRDLMLDGNKANQTDTKGTGLRLLNVSHCHAARVTAHEFPSDGFYVGGFGTAGLYCQHVTVRDCHSHHNNRHGLSITNGEHVTVTGCTIEQNAICGIDIEPNQTRRAKFITLEGNTFVDNVKAIQVLKKSPSEVEGIVITGNHIRVTSPDLDIGTRGVYCGQDGMEGVMISHNVIIGHFASGIFWSKANHLTVMGNYIVQLGPPTGTQGGTQGILIGRNSQRVTMIGNICRGFTSGITSVGTADDPNHLLTMAFNNLENCTTPIGLRHTSTDSVLGNQMAQNGAVIDSYDFTDGRVVDVAGTRLHDIPA